MLDKPELTEKLKEVEKKIGYQFQNPFFLIEAFTHRSILNEDKSFSTSNERLEYLGDAVLELIVREHLFQRIKNENEGILSKLGAHLVDQKACIRYLKKLDIETYLIKGAGSQNLSHGKALANLFEAIVGAIFLDGGYEKVKKFMLIHFQKDFENELKIASNDSKTELQELMQKQFQDIPKYKVLEELGPEHSKKFVVGVYFEEKLLSVGEGRSKREAEKMAAGLAIEKIRKEGAW